MITFIPTFTYYKWTSRRRRYEFDVAKQLADRLFVKSFSLLNSKMTKDSSSSIVSMSLHSQQMSKV